MQKQFHDRRILLCCAISSSYIGKQNVCQWSVSLLKSCRIKIPKIPKREVLHSSGKPKCEGMATQISLENKKIFFAILLNSVGKENKVGERCTGWPFF